MRKGFLIIAAIGFMYSCGGSGTSKDQDAEKPSVDEFSNIAKQLSEGHNSKNSLDYKGTYTGVLPTETGEGMKVVLTLSDSTFTRTTEYIGKKEKLIEEKDIYGWNTQGSIITLRGVTGPSQYKVGENTLTQLDANGKVIEGNMADKYILRK